MDQKSVVIIGAGVAGLCLARKLQQQGHNVVIVERSRGVGGRCATRRVEGQAVDHGVPLLHGQSAELREAVDELEGCTIVADWPFHVRGEGKPCRPAGYDSRSFRVAIAEGINRFAKHLARDLDVRQQFEVQRLETNGQQFVVHRDGGALEASHVVLTCPAAQVASLIEPLAETNELRGLLRMLTVQLFNLPCLTTIALYERESASDWHLHLPGAQSPITSLINDSSKRPTGKMPRQALVIQGSPAFSRECLDADVDSWSKTLLQAAAAELGDWVLEPAVMQSHRWRYSRLQLGYELRQPVFVRWEGARLGLCGEAFNPAGGVEGAFLSGLALARRIETDDATPVKGN